MYVYVSLSDFLDRPTTNIPYGSQIMNNAIMLLIISFARTKTYSKFKLHIKSLVPIVLYKFRQMVVYKNSRGSVTYPVRAEAAASSFHELQITMDSASQYRDTYTRSIFMVASNITFQGAKGERMFTQYKRYMAGSLWQGLCHDIQRQEEVVEYQSTEQ
ncbi:hypothetical protein Leryth_022246, partial [Lithospermum erythrorhizon]